MESYEILSLRMARLFFTRACCTQVGLQPVRDFVSDCICAVGPNGSKVGVVVSHSAALTLKTCHGDPFAPIAVLTLGDSKSFGYIWMQYEPIAVYGELIHFLFRNSKRRDSSLKPSSHCQSTFTWSSRSIGPACIFHCVRMPVTCKGAQQSKACVRQTPRA